MQDLNKLNDFFMNKEEDIVIRLQNLEDRSKSISTPEEQQQIKTAFVKLHGEQKGCNSLCLWSLHYHASHPERALQERWCCFSIGVC